MRDEGLNACKSDNGSGALLLGSDPVPMASVLGPVLGILVSRSSFLKNRVQWATYRKAVDWFVPDRRYHASCN